MLQPSKNTKEISISITITVQLKKLNKPAYLRPMQLKTNRCDLFINT